jgi:hypothetical protein
MELCNFNHVNQLPLAASCGSWFFGFLFAASSAADGIFFFRQRRFFS